MRWNGSSHFDFDEKSMEIETTTTEFRDRGKVIVGLARQKKGINPKNQDYEVTVRDLSRKINHLSKVNWDRKIITEFTRSISCTSIG